MQLVFYTIIIALLVCIDQWTKTLVETYLIYQLPVHVFGPLSWFRTWNEGIAFSMLSFIDNKILAILTILLSVGIVWLWKNMRQQTNLMRYSLTDPGFILILSGAIGNLIDRLLYGHVVDFILLQAGQWSFAIFNLADSFISVGATMIVIDEIRRMRFDSKKAKHDNFNDEN